MHAGAPASWPMAPCPPRPCCPRGQAERAPPQSRRTGIGPGPSSCTLSDSCLTDLVSWSSIVALDSRAGPRSFRFLRAAECTAWSLRASLRTSLSNGAQLWMATTRGGLTGCRGRSPTSQHSAGLIVCGLPPHADASLDGFPPLAARQSSRRPRRRRGFERGHRERDSMSSGCRRLSDVPVLSCSLLCRSPSRRSGSGWRTSRCSPDTSEGSMTSQDVEPLFVRRLRLATHAPR